MPGTIRLGAVLVLLAAAVALPACGGSDEISGEIPATHATDLNNALASVSAEIEAGCTDPDQAQEQAQAFVDKVNELPADPSGEVKQELQDAAAHLRALVESECASTEPPATTQSTTTSTDPATSSTTDTTTTDTTTTDTTTTTTSTDEEPPPGNGNGSGPPNGVPPGNGGTGGTGSGEGDE